MKKVLLVLVAVMLFGFVGKAQITPGVYIIESVYYSNTVLTANSKGVICLTNLNKANPSQKWQITDLGTGFYRLEYLGVANKAMGYVVIPPAEVTKVYERKRGIQIELIQISGTNTTQAWQFVKQSDGTYQILNKGGSNLAIDANASSLGPVNLVLKHGGKNQKWKLIKL